MLIGETLGPYRVLEKLGEGGMGEVYKTRDTRLGRIVAVKVANEQFSERSAREARAVAALNHPHICQLYDVGPDYLVMEYVEGAPIRSTEDIAKVLAGQIADGLAAAHHAGVVHRDLKPANILLTPQGQVKILDFGLATIESESVAERDAATRSINITNAGTTVGTVAYMSPEQARGQAVDARTDLWSLGVILYELTTGTRPFEGPTSPVVFEALLSKAPTPVRERNPRVPADCRRIVHRLLEKDRNLRYQSAADVRAELKRLERDSSATLVTAAAPPSRRSPAWTYGIGAVATAAILAAGFLFWRQSHAAPLTDQDVLVLADFANTTGDPVFDVTLREALAVQLEESPFLKILSGEAVREDLQLMGRSPGRTHHRRHRAPDLRAGKPESHDRRFHCASG